MLSKLSVRLFVCLFVCEPLFYQIGLFVLQILITYPVIMRIKAKSLVKQRKDIIHEKRVTITDAMEVKTYFIFYQT